MKTLFRMVLLLPVAVLLLASSCKKDDLPKPTQSGANKMFAKINGNKWENAACWSCIGGGSGISTTYRANGLSGITGQSLEGKNSIAISVVFKSITQPGTYDLGAPGMLNDRKNNAQIRIDDKIYSTTSVNKGRLTITRLDTVTKIMAGTFEFTAEDEKDSTSIVHVTDGWFDAKFD